ncbi:hypothetical protein FJZ31_24460 [Candidatus Poribacteria bacterium]|nr:hypothetical protein [Candidatus Poribacteria bacterium]
MKIKVVLKGQKGFTFIESLIFLSILLWSIAGTLSLLTYGFRNLVLPRHLAIANNLVRANMEEIKNAPKFTDIKKYDNTPPDSPTLYTSFRPEPDRPEPKLRPDLLPGEQLTINVDNSNPDLLNISVTVSWQEENLPNRTEVELVTLVASP